MSVSVWLSSIAIVICVSSSKDVSRDNIGFFFFFCVDSNWRAEGVCRSRGRLGGGGGEGTQRASDMPEGSKLLWLQKLFLQLLSLLLLSLQSLWDLCFPRLPGEMSMAITFAFGEAEERVGAMLLSVSVLDVKPVARSPALSQLLLLVTPTEIPSLLLDPDFSFTSSQSLSRTSLLYAWLWLRMRCT